MACHTLIIDGKAVGIACGPRRRRVPCSVTGCPNPRIYLCDFPLAGAKTGKTCSRGLCEKHRGRACSATAENCGWRGVSVGRQCPGCGEPLEELDFCPVHVKMEIAEPDPLEEALAGRPWACNRQGAGCGWKGKRSDLVNVNPQGIRVCPACGASGGLQSIDEGQGSLFR